MSIKEESTNAQAVAQEAINKRLSDLRFKVLSGTEFDADAGNHSIQQITFVVRKDENDDTYIELYKGDSKIGSLGGNGSGVRALHNNTRAGGERIVIDHCVFYGDYGSS